MWGISHLVYRWTENSAPAEPIVIAHRGGAALAPENTLAAFRQASASGVDFLETDVRQTRDGVLVLMHDASVNRTTNGVGRVAELNASDLARLRSRGEPVPTFTEFLAVARETRANILPEVKGQFPGIEDALVQCLSTSEMLPRTVVQSFSRVSLQRLHTICPELKLCRLYYPWDLWVGDNPAGVSVVSPMAEALLLNPWMVRQAHRRGLQVWPWFAGLESDFTVSWVLSLGVDGLMLDDPRRLVGFVHNPGAVRGPSSPAPKRTARRTAGGFPP